MQLGFVSAILPDLTLEEVLAFAADEGFGCVELMCWPPGGADRRYAGVTHIDVTRFGDDEVGRVRDVVDKRGVSISGLGYYPNPLHPDAEHRQKVIGHLLKVISAAPRLDVRDVGTHIVHVHAKDTRIDRDKLYAVGVLGLGWHTPKLPGLGDVDWGRFFSALTDVGYNGSVCIEVEDRAYEGSRAERTRALRQ